MALIYPGIECALCGQVIADDLLKSNAFVATSHFIGEPSHPLWRFSDAAMHCECFMAWDKRSEFVRLFNETVEHHTWGDGNFTHMNDDGEIVTNKR